MDLDVIDEELEDLQNVLEELEQQELEQQFLGSEEEEEEEEE